MKGLKFERNGETYFVTIEKSKYSSIHIYKQVKRLWWWNFKEVKTYNLQGLLIIAEDLEHRKFDKKAEDYLVQISNYAFDTYYKDLKETEEHVSQTRKQDLYFEKMCEKM